MLIRNGTDTYNCLIDLLSKLLFKTSIRHWEAMFVGTLKNLIKSFTHEDYANDTELSGEYWDIKRNKFIPKVTWSIVRECLPYRLSKSYINKCRHLNKHTLLRHDSKD